MAGKFQDAKGKAAGAIGKIVMLIRMSDWERVRVEFSQAEKDNLNKAITGETICPRGLMIDESQAPSEARKLQQFAGQRTAAQIAKIISLQVLTISTSTCTITHCQAG